MKRLKCKLSQRRDGSQNRNPTQHNDALVEEPIDTTNGSHGRKFSQPKAKTESVNGINTKKKSENSRGRNFSFLKNRDYKSMINNSAGHIAKTKGGLRGEKSASTRIEVSASDKAYDNDHSRSKNNNSSSLGEQNINNVTSPSNKVMKRKTNLLVENKSKSTSTISVANQSPPVTFSRSISALASTSDENTNDTLISSHDDYQRILKAAHSLDNVGNSQFERKEYQDALKSYSTALRLKRTSLNFRLKTPDATEQLLASVATSINNIGYLRQCTGGCTLDEIMMAYQDSLQIKKEILGVKDLSVGKTLNNIGSVYFGEHAYEDAMKAYEEALEIIVSNLGPKHLDVATVHSNIGDVHLATKKLEQSRKSYREALKIRWAHLSDNDPKISRLLEKIATIEMADTPRELIRQRLFARMDGEYYANASDDEEEIDLKKLGEAVKNDVSYVEMVKRKLALEMIRDKIVLLRDMRRIEESDEMPSRDSDATSLTRDERNSALSSVKERIKQMKEQRQSTSASARDLANTLAPPTVIRSIPRKLESQYDDVEGAAVFKEDWISPTAQRDEIMSRWEICTIRSDQSTSG